LIGKQGKDSLTCKGNARFWPQGRCSLFHGGLAPVVDNRPKGMMPPRHTGESPVLLLFNTDISKRLPFEHRRR
jgi:hypothetical protein